MTAPHFAILSSGVFFIVGLLGGVWKYSAIRRSSSANAPVYVDIFHRSSLMYAFACLVLAEFTRLSAWPNWINLLSVIAIVIFFALAISSYAVHGWLNDTDNQLRRPHRVGRREVPAWLISIFMWGLVAGELGGFLVLFSGFAQSLASGK